MTDQENLELLFANRPVMKPSAATWAKHLLLLAVTFCTATLAGTMFPFGRFDSLPAADPQSLSELGQLLLEAPTRYAAFIAGAVQSAFSAPGQLTYGLEFSISLLFILICHEMGHYVMCRRYHVDATLPFFLPTPPMIGPAGTFGAFIKILSPMPSRKAVFDIGVAGPIAGFIALIPVAIIGLSTITVVTPDQLGSPEGTLTFTDPLLLRLFALFFGINLKLAIGNAFYFAAWVGLLVTALNLIPSGQLDGGHAIYAVFGEKVHRWTGRIAFPVMATLSIVGLIYYGSPSGFLVAVILAIMMRVRHPRPWDMASLDTKRKVIAFLTLVIFVLCFVPFPIQIN
ncbi:MAG TPA: site-2 protease family protein [Pyrinomonadaceae bacterium]|jgi:membrane-associated protease RseP (regulator of RpoE activity)|nr:site-2 protease family protein [Pyrinomonadaceae bacterium]